MSEQATISATANVSADPVTMTDAAINRVIELISEEENTDLKLRVFISGGGCSGFQYGFTFEEKQDMENDLLLSKTPSVLTATNAKVNSIQLLVDTISLQYLAGATIDYKDDIEGGHFVIRNPNASGTCGCGSSFSA